MRQSKDAYHRDREVRNVLGLIFDSMDAEERKRKPKTKIHGKRAEFLKNYKVLGYEAAKDKLNKPFGKEVFKDEDLKQWIEDEK